MQILILLCTCKHSACIYNMSHTHTVNFVFTIIHLIQILKYDNCKMECLLSVIVHTSHSPLRNASLFKCRIFFGYPWLNFRSLPSQIYTESPCSVQDRCPPGLFAVHLNVWYLFNPGVMHQIHSPIDSGDDYPQQRGATGTTKQDYSFDIVISSFFSLFYFRVLYNMRYFLAPSFFTPNKTINHLDFSQH